MPKLLLTMRQNICWGLGQVIGVGAIKGTSNIAGPNSFRIPFALQWMWPLPLAIAIFMAPESPWWLVRRGRVEDAKKSLLRLTSIDREADFDADETVAMIAHTTALEEQMSEGASYLDCFRGVDCEYSLTARLIDANPSQYDAQKSCVWSGPFRICVAILSSAIPLM